METRASYILVGAFVLSIVAAAFAFVIWFARIEFDEAPQRYAVYFTGSVSGLAIGSPVRYRGVPVGSVHGIRIDPKNVERIEVILNVAQDAPIKEDTVAKLGLQGITGVAYIQLTGGTQASPRLVPKKGESIAVIASRPSGLEQVLEQAPQLFEKALVLAERMSRLVDDQNLKSVSDTLYNFRSLSENLVDRAKSLEKLLDDGKGTMSSLRDASRNIAVISGDIRKRAGPLTDSAQEMMTGMNATMEDIRRLAQNFSRVAETLDSIVEENRGPIRDFSSGGLYELTQFIAEARILVAGLTRLSAQIERDPARFFFGDTQKGFEAR